MPNSDSAAIDISQPSLERIEMLMERLAQDLHKTATAIASIKQLVGMQDSNRSRSDSDSDQPVKHKIYKCQKLS